MLGMTIIGAPAKLAKADEETKLKFASGLTIGNKKLKMIKLSLKPDAVRGEGASKRVRGFQTVEVTIDRARNKQVVRLSTDGEGKASSVMPVTFNPDGFGAKTAYVADTEFNRKVFARTYFSGSYIIDDEDVDTAMRKAAEARKKLRDNAYEKAGAQAKKEIYAQKSTFIAPLKEKYGTAMEDMDEYKEVITPLINKRTKEIFYADNSWENAKPSTTKASDK